LIIIPIVSVIARTVQNRQIDAAQRTAIAAYARYIRFQFQGIFFFYGVAIFYRTARRQIRNGHTVGAQRQITQVFLTIVLIIIPIVSVIARTVQNRQIDAAQRTAIAAYACHIRFQFQGIFFFYGVAIFYRTARRQIRYGHAVGAQRQITQVFLTIVLIIIPIVSVITRTIQNRQIDAAQRAAIAAYARYIRFQFQGVFFFYRIAIFYCTARSSDPSDGYAVGAQRQITQVFLTIVLIIIPVVSVIARTI
jgi:nitrate reductase NapE component